MHVAIEISLHHPRSKVVKSFVSIGSEMPLSNLMPSIGQPSAVTVSDAKKPKILCVRGVGGAPLALFFWSPGLSSRNEPEL
jgi:hypothetical protein